MAVSSIPRLCKVFYFASPCWSSYLLLRSSTLFNTLFTFSGTLSFTFSISIAIVLTNFNSLISRSLSYSLRFESSSNRQGQFIVDKAVVPIVSASTFFTISLNGITHLSYSCSSISIILNLCSFTDKENIYMWIVDESFTHLKRDEQFAYLMVFSFILFVTLLRK